MQTAPVTERKHFYRTEVYQVQDRLLAETVDVNNAIVLGAALAVMQTTAARSGMLTKDHYDAKSVRWSEENPLRKPAQGGVCDAAKPARPAARAGDSSGSTADACAQAV